MKTILHNLLLTGMLMCISIPLLAQNSTFKVLMTQGVVEGMKPNMKTWFRVYPTIELPSETKIRLSSNSYGTFLSSEGVLVEYEKKGEYVLKPTKKAAHISSIQKIGNFVNQAMQSGTQSDLAGSIVRNVGGVNPQFPYDTKLLTPTVKLQWYAEKAQHFEVKITDESGATVLTKQTNDSSLTLNFVNDIPALKRSVCYYWSVSNTSLASSGSAPMCIVYFDDETVSLLQNERKQLMEEVSFSEKSALSWYILGAWYEEKKLFCDALECYSKCEALHPTVDLYKNAVTNYLGKFQAAK